MHEVFQIITLWGGASLVGWLFFCFFLIRNDSLDWCTGGLACAFHAAAIPAS